MYHYAGNNPIRYVDPDGRSGEDKNIDWCKEVFDIFSEVKIGLSDKFSLSIPNVVQLEVELDIVSNDWVNNKGDTSESGMTSGLTLAIQFGPDDCPLLLGSLKYTKQSPQMGNAFSLFDVDYEFSKELKINQDFEVTPPIPFVNLTFNLSEVYDLLSKIRNEVGAYIQQSINEVKK